MAVLWANSPWGDAYQDLRHLQLGPLDVEHWAADGALTLFFYLAGLELKREFLVGSLRRPRDAMVPIVAAVAGVATPAAIYTLVNLVGGGDLRGWAIPAATDIAFALAVLAVVGSALPSQLRAFLLTLAIVDDLVVILIIALFYTSALSLVPLLVAVGLLGVFAVLQRIRGESWLWYVPLSVAIWWFMHESGIHATIAGVAMGLLTRVRLDPGEAHSPAERLEYTLTPLSAGVAVPFFALMSAGVVISGGGDAGDRPGRPRASPPDSSSASRSACSAARSWSPGSPAPSSTRRSPGATWSASPSWPGSVSRSRCWWPTCPTRARGPRPRRPPC